MGSKTRQRGGLPACLLLGWCLCATDHVSSPLALLNPLASDPFTISTHFGNGGEGQTSYMRVGELSRELQT